MQWQSICRNKSVGKIRFPYPVMKSVVPVGVVPTIHYNRRVTPVTTSIVPPDLAAAALLDVRAVAALLDFSPRHVYRLADAGRMPAPVRIGCLVRWRRTDLDSWLAAGCPSMRRATP
jgi:excisionase family DNA binding protein